MCNSQPRSSSNGDNSREGGDNQHWQGLYPDISEMFSNMDTSNSNDQSQGRSPGQVFPIMLLLHQLIIKINLHHLQLNNKHLLLLHQLLDINISKHLLLLNRISSAPTVPGPEEDKMIVDNILRT